MDDFHSMQIHQYTIINHSYSILIKFMDMNSPFISKIILPQFFVAWSYPMCCITRIAVTTLGWRSNQACAASSSLGGALNGSQ